jgi:hypothetical protein
VWVEIVSPVDDLAALDRYHGDVTVAIWPSGRGDFAFGRVLQRDRRVVGAVNSQVETAIEEERLLVAAVELDQALCPSTRRG